MMWVLLAGIAWTAVILFVGLFIGGSLARADRRREEAARPPVREAVFGRLVRRDSAQRPPRREASPSSR